MNLFKNSIKLLWVCCLVSSCSAWSQDNDKTSSIQSVVKVNKTTAEWEKQLTPEQYKILRQQGTERAFTGKYWDNNKAGSYVCAGCNHPLFSSETKFKSGTGWPSYYQPETDTSIIEHTDNSHGWIRVEVVCAKCDGHLGHVFEDGPKPTKLRYCINSASLNFISN